jgi:hypothetical protein
MVADVRGGNEHCSLARVQYQNVPMFGLFKRKTERERLEEELKRLQEEAYRLSHSDRRASDLKTAEAHALLQRIEALPKP